jgi:hypothetical protein
MKHTTNDIQSRFEAILEGAIFALVFIATLIVLAFAVDTILMLFGTLAQYTR